MRLLSRILMNPSSQVYLRQLQKEFNVSSNTVRLELNKLTDMKLIQAISGDNTKLKIYTANTLHPLYGNLRNIIFKYIGIEHLIEEVFFKLGSLDEVYLTGDISEGKDVLIIDLVVVGDINRMFFNSLIEKAEILLDKKIRTAFYLKSEFSPQILSNVKSVCIFKFENGGL
jgi:hypothetical protein